MDKAILVRVTESMFRNMQAIEEKILQPEALVAIAKAGDVVLKAYIISTTRPSEEAVIEPTSSVESEEGFVEKQLDTAKTKVTRKKVYDWNPTQMTRLVKTFKKGENTIDCSMYSTHQAISFRSAICRYCRIVFGKGKCKTHYSPGDTVVKVVRF